MSPDYPLAFLTGLLGGSSHCLGMCGPIVAAFSLHGGAGSRLPSHLLYHSGRVITYTFIGAVMGLAGSFVNVAGRMAGIQNAVAVAAGLLMIFMGLGIAGLLPSPTRLERGAGPFLRAASAVLESGSPARLLPLGLLLGFLPCGLSYTVFAGAAATGSLVKGFALALSFGIGTAVPLLAAGLVLGSLGVRARGALSRAGGGVVVVMGILFLKRGISSLAAM